MKPRKPVWERPDTTDGNAMLAVREGSPVPILPAQCVTRYRRRKKNGKNQKSGILSDTFSRAFVTIGAGYYRRKGEFRRRRGFPCQHQLGNAVSESDVTTKTR